MIADEKTHFPYRNLTVARLLQTDRQTDQIGCRIYTYLSAESPLQKLGRYLK